MAFSITEFKSQLTGGGARPTLFEVELTNPVTGSADSKFKFMAKAASLPASTLSKVEAPYMGRKIQLHGDRTFEPWTVTIINDEDFLIRNALESWSNAINSHEGNVSSFTTSSPSLYKTQAQVIQYGKSGNVLREVTFEGMFPTEISSIELGWETNDTIEEFTCNFEYDYWRISGGITGVSTS